MAVEKITFSPLEKTVTVKLGGEVFARSSNALLLHEKGLPDAVYIPASDVKTDLFTRSDYVTHCPKKGDATHWHIAAGDTQIENAAWSYEDPITQAIPIKGHFAFYPNKAETLTE